MTERPATLERVIARSPRTRASRQGRPGVLALATVLVGAALLASRLNGSNLTIRYDATPFLTNPAVLLLN